MMRILLDAGHYADYNKGVIEGYWESRNNWEFVEKIIPLLKERGFEVFKTREDEEKDLALYDRGYLCKKYKADIFISYHSNAAEPNIKGAVCMYSYNYRNDKEYVEIARKLAQNIGDTMGSGLQSYWTKKSANGEYDYMGVLRGAVYGAGCKNAFILERGFHTNKEDCSWLMSNANLDKLAAAQADCLAEIFLNGEQEEKMMRYFKLSEDMNMRQTPNGTVIGVVPEKAVISGDTLQKNNGIEWLKTTFNGKTGYVAVLPASKNYAVEVFEPTDDGDDCKFLYEQKVNELSAAMAKIDELNEKLLQINRISSL